MSPTLRRGQALLFVVVTGLVVVSSVAAVGDVTPNRQESPPQSLSDTAASTNQVHPVVTNATLPTTGAAWGLPRGNPANTNYLNTSGPSNPITTRWTFDLKDKEKNMFTNRPVVADGTVYFSARHMNPGDESEKSVLYAVDPWTGEERESFTPTVVQDKRISALAVFRDTLYVGTREGKVYALNATTGDMYWKIVTDGRPTGLTIAKRTLYVTSKGTARGTTVPDGHVYALDALTGEEQWMFTTDVSPGGPFKGPPAVKDGTVYASERYGLIYALDAQTGVKRWHVRVDEDHERISNPAVANGLVYIGEAAINSKSNTLYALDAETGKQRWSYEATGDVKAPPAVLNQTAFLGVKDDGTYALDAETGEERWHINSPSGTPVLVNGMAYINDGENLYGLDPTTGEKQARFTLEDSKEGHHQGFASGLAVLNGSLYAGVGVNHQAFGWYDSTKFYALGTPEFTYSNLSVTPRNVDPGEPVTATVTVSNTGTGPGRFNATLTVNDAIVNATTGRLDAGASRTVTFTYVFEEDGAYTVGINGRTQNIGVGDATPAPSPTPTKTSTGGEVTPTDTVTPESTPGFGVGVWVAAFALVAGLVGLRKRR